MTWFLKSLLLLLPRLATWMLENAKLIAGLSSGAKSMLSQERQDAQRKKRASLSSGWTMRDFDSIYEKEGQGIPVPFLRALAARESNTNPSEATGSAWGLLQVGHNARSGNVLADYNRRHGTALAPHDLLDPRVNVLVAAELLNRIVAEYARLGIAPNWGNGNFVGLVAAGWNAGWSRRAGTTKVIEYLKRKGIPVTLAAVYKQASAARATGHLSDPKKQKWQRSVVAATFDAAHIERRREGTAGSQWAPLLLLLLLVS